MEAETNKEKTKVVIVGGVAGGASCAARLRRLNENADTALIQVSNPDDVRNVVLKASWSKKGRTSHTRTAACPTTSGA